MSKGKKKAPAPLPPLPPKVYGPLQFKYQLLPPMVGGDHRPYIIAMVEVEGVKKVGMFAIDPTQTHSRIDDEAAAALKITPSSGLITVTCESTDGRFWVMQKMADKLVGNVLEDSKLTGVLGANWFGSYTPEFDDFKGVLTFMPKGFRLPYTHKAIAPTDDFPLGEACSTKDPDCEACQ
jgi:hypothetical protein